MSYISKEEFAMVVKEYQIEFYRLAMAILKNEADAQDAVGDAIVRAFEQRSAVKDKKKVKSWIMTIIVNTAKTMLKKNGRVIYFEDIKDIKEEKTEKRDEIWDIVLELEYEYRVVLVLYYYERFSTSEISQMLHIPEGTVKSRLARAREKLRKLL